MVWFSFDPQIVPGSDRVLMFLTFAARRAAGVLSDSQHTRSTALNSTSLVRPYQNLQSGIWLWYDSWYTMMKYDDICINMSNMYLYLFTCVACLRFNSSGWKMSFVLGEPHPIWWTSPIRTKLFMGGGPKVLWNKFRRICGQKWYQSIETDFCLESDTQKQR